MLSLGFIDEVFKYFQPDIVVHSAGVSSVFVADLLGKEKTFAINSEATRYLAEKCNQTNAKLIFLSTDLVYSSSEKLISESSYTNPLTLYSSSKLAAEEQIIKATQNFLILRCGLIFGFGISLPKNHFHQSYLRIKNLNSVNLFFNQYRTPVSYPQVVQAIIAGVENDITGEVINIGGNYAITRFKLIEILVEVAGLSKNMLNPVEHTKNMSYSAPKVLRLDSKRRESFGIKFNDFGVEIKDCLEFAKRNIFVN